MSLRMLVIAVGLLLCPGGLWVTQARAQTSTPTGTPDDALQSILASAQPGAKHDCGKPADALDRILCAGTLRVGVRSDYPLFSQLDHGALNGFEVQLANLIASRLGVALQLIAVKPANRLAALAEGSVDLVIATMGHTTLRDRNAGFIRPHYYASESVVVGDVGNRIPGFRQLAGQTVCVTVGNASNIELAAHGARLMLFTSPDQLLNQLEAGNCPLISQDNSFFARAFSNPDFARKYDMKFTFAPVPWGMAVARTGATKLAGTLSLLSQIFNRDGVLVGLARENHIATGFLQQQQAVWNRPACNTPGGSLDPACALPPVADDVAPTRFAAEVAELEGWLAPELGIHVVLSIFKIQATWDLVQKGIFNSLVLIGGTLLTTSAAALLFGAWLSAPSRWLRAPPQFLVMVLQSTPVVLSLIIAAAIANAVFPFSSTSALITAMAVLGLTNGANAGQAISEAIHSLQAERRAAMPAHSAGREPAIFLLGMARASQQIEAFLINAAKGTPVASFIGAPELLNALADTSSFSSDRITANVVLLIFYVVCVLVVVGLCAMLRVGLSAVLSRSRFSTRRFA